MAEFVKVTRDAKRMCNSFKNCEGCPVKLPLGDCKLNFTYNDSFCKTESEEIEEKVEQWAESHPEKTKFDVLQKMFPKANFNLDSFCFIKTFGAVKNCVECTEKYKGAGCLEVIKEFLNSPYEEPKKEE